MTSETRAHYILHFARVYKYLSHSTQVSMLCHIRN